MKICEMLWSVESVKINLVLLKITHSWMLKEKKNRIKVWTARTEREKGTITDKSYKYTKGKNETNKEKNRSELKGKINNERVEMEVN